MLIIIYWILLILAIIAFFAPPNWSYAPKFVAVVTFILFVILGLKICRVAW